MPQLSTSHVFMSYSRRDEVVMQHIAAFLRGQGINVWVDNEKLVPGTPIWEEEIEEAIHSASAVVVVLSPDSKNSVWVRREISFAERYNKRIFPIMVAGDEDSSITLRLTTSQYVDIRKNEEIGLNSLKRALALYFGELEAHEKAKADSKAEEKDERETAEKAAREKAETERNAREEAERIAQQNAKQEWISERTSSSIHTNAKPASAVIHQKNIVSKMAAGGVFFVILGLVILGALYKFGYLSSEPKLQIVLEPDYSLVTTIKNSDLETASEILTHRARSLGYKTASFAVSENNQIIGQITYRNDTDIFLERIIQTGLLEFVDFGETSIPIGTTISTDFGYNYVSEGDEKKWHTVLTGSVIESASVKQSSSGEQYLIEFSLTPNGQQVFAEFTTNNIGRYLGIVLDKTVISVPSINSAITDGVGQIAGNFTKEEAESLAAYLNAKGPLPIPMLIKQTYLGD